MHRSSSSSSSSALRVGQIEARLGVVALGKGAKGNPGKVAKVVLIICVMTSPRGAAPAEMHAGSHMDLDLKPGKVVGNKEGKVVGNKEGKEVRGEIVVGLMANHFSSKVSWRIRGGISAMDRCLQPVRMPL